MRKFLNTDYPFYYDIKTTITIGVSIFLLSTLFSFLFEPFEVNYEELKFSFFTISIIHSLVSFFAFVSLSIILNKIRSVESEWKIKDEFLFLCVVLLIIGVFQFLIRDFIYEKDDNWSLIYLFEEIRNTLLVGSLLIFFIISINVERLKGIYGKRSSKIKIETLDIENKNDEVLIKTQVKSDDFLLKIDEFIFAKSDKNYLEVYLLNDVKNVKRITIKSFQEQLSNYGFIVKTHRSYLVNLKFITAVKGNTQGYLVSLKSSECNVPVSRSMIAQFENELSNLK